MFFINSQVILAETKVQFFLNGDSVIKLSYTFRNGSFLALQYYINIYRSISISQVVYSLQKNITGK